MGKLALPPSKTPSCQPQNEHMYSATNTQPYFSYSPPHVAHYPRSSGPASFGHRMPFEYPPYEPPTYPRPHFFLHPSKYYTYQLHPYAHHLYHDQHPQSYGAPPTHSSQHAPPPQHMMSYLHGTRHLFMRMREMVPFTGCQS